jgi:hypothetical protein
VEAGTAGTAVAVNGKAFASYFVRLVAWYSTFLTIDKEITAPLRGIAFFWPLAA